MKINEELEKLEEAYFLLQMSDTWTSEDYRYADELKEKIKKIKAGEKNVN